MANTAQAKKRARQNEQRRQHNASQRSTVRTFIKAVRKAIAAGKKTEAEAAFKAAVPVLDGMAAKGIVPKNAAARYKSRMNNSIRAL